MWMALFAGLGLGFFGSIPVAGPASILVLKNALEKGSRQGIDIAGGAALGEAIYAFVAFWGLTTVLERFPVLIPASKITGAVLVMVLGIYLVVRRVNPKEVHAANLADRQERRWLRGFLSAVLNPTLLATWTTVVTGLHAASLVEPSPRGAFPFALGVGIGIVGWFAFLIQVVVRRFRDRLQPTAIQRLVRGFGWAMIGIGAVIMSRAVLHLGFS
ncbi:MAG TPA: LysE family transporter [Polyangiaceae bacterium]|nr:LysE family transporter [Polyangiaceae bacterium]